MDGTISFYPNQKKMMMSKLCKVVILTSLQPASASPSLPLSMALRTSGYMIDIDNACGKHEGITVCLNLFTALQS